MAGRKGRPSLGDIQDQLKLRGIGAGGTTFSRLFAVRENIVALPHYVLLLFAALAAAVVAQGGYYLPGRFMATALVGAALIIALWNRHWSNADPGLVLVICSGLAVWAVVRAALNGAFLAAVPTVASVVCLAGALLVAQRSDSAQRELCALTAVGIGALVAVTGWIAVVWRVPSWTTVADGLLRAASTLTYPNAAAALLASLSVVAISLQQTRPGSLVRVGATYMLLVGLGVTLSRAGLLALLIGVVVLSLLAGVRSVARQVASPSLGAVIAVGALAPSFPISAPPRPALATLGLATGLVIAVGLGRLRAKVRAVAPMIGLVLATTAVIALVNSSQVMHTLVERRVTLSSPDRSNATHAAVDLVAARPVMGMGPGRAWFSWVAPDGQIRVMRYVHNEYLQVLVELGAIGLGLVLCLLLAVVVTVRRGRPSTDPPTLWAGAVAALAVLLVHSGFDFLWHLPVILLTAGLLIGLAGRPITTNLSRQPGMKAKERLYADQVNSNTNQV